MNGSSLRPYQRAANRHASRLCCELEPVLASALRRAALVAHGDGSVDAWVEFIKHISLTQALELLAAELPAPPISGYPTQAAASTAHSGQAAGQA